MTGYVILDTRTNPDHPLGDAIETFIRRVDAERFIEEVRGDDSALRRARATTEFSSYLRIEEDGELGAGSGCKI